MLGTASYDAMLHELISKAEDRASSWDFFWTCTRQTRHWMQHFIWDYVGSVLSMLLAVFISFIFGSEFEVLWLLCTFAWYDFLVCFLWHVMDVDKKYIYYELSLFPLLLKKQYYSKNIFFFHLWGWHIFLQHELFQGYMCVSAPPSFPYSDCFLKPERILTIPLVSAKYRIWFGLRDGPAEPNSLLFFFSPSRGTSPPSCRLHL